MNEDSLRKAKAALERAGEEHEREMHLAAAEMRARMEASTAKMQKALETFQREVGTVPQAGGGTPRALDRRKRRPPPRWNGGLEPAPVIPRPKPMPLKGGAEAPLD